MISTQSNNNSTLLASSRDYLRLALELGIIGHALPSGDHIYCRCPLHDDHSASFSLNLGNGLWFCHAEQRGGMFTQLVMEVLELDLLSAERWIIEQSYVAPTTPTVQHIVKPTPAMYDDTLTQYTRAEMPKYWFDRGYSWEIADRFGVRYDKVGRRLAIPVRFPLSGPIVGIVYRSVGDPSWKYRNTPDFPKKTTLFAYDPQLRPDAILLTEGPLDALTAIQAGWVAYATFGAYVTDDQVRMIKEPARKARLIVAYDNDKAGRKASNDVAHKLLQMNFSAWLFCFPKDRKDIGECSSEEIAYGVANAHRDF